MIRIVALSLVAVALGAACTLMPDSYRGASAPRAETIVPLKSERPVLGLALGGGGARGFAHIGVIKALEAAGIVPDVVTGASSGAVIAALYAGGHDGRRLEEIARDLNRSDLVDFVLIGRGWVRGEALQDFVNRMVGDRPIERLARPFAVVATAAKSGRMTVFNRGNTGLAVRASASVPDLFIPPVIDGEEFIDGGITSPVPVRIARAMGADVVIAVDVSWFAQIRSRDAGADPAGMARKKDSDGTTRTTDSDGTTRKTESDGTTRYKGSDGTTRYGRSGRYVLLNEELTSADVVVSPRTVPTRMLDFDQKEANIAAGEEAARAVLPDLKAALARAAAGKSAAAAPAANGN